MYLQTIKIFNKFTIYHVELNFDFINSNILNHASAMSRAIAISKKMTMNLIIKIKTLNFAVKTSLYCRYYHIKCI